MTARFATSADTGDLIAWDWAFVTIARDSPDVPADVRRQGRDARKAWRDAWLRTDEGQAYRTMPRSFEIVVLSGSALRVEDVPAGSYALRAKFLWQFGKGCEALESRVATVQTTFEVAPVPDGFSDEPLDLGTLTLTPAEPPTKPKLKVGDAAPDFEVKALDGRTLRLKDFRGKYVLLDFWATWCGPCLAKMPMLKALHKKFGEDERFVFIGLSLDSSKRDLKEYLARQELKWVQAWLGESKKTPVPGAYGVRGIPAMFLIGPDGKILAVKISPTEAERELERLLKKED
ncbi:MAG: TlpA disulfide reductase family protein [Planctomycetota bacterium]